MPVIFTLTLLAMLTFAVLYAGTRANVSDLRERLDDAYEARDAVMVQLQAAEAKAAQLAATVYELAQTADLSDADAFLLELEAEMDGEAHGLAAILSANDIAEEQA